MWLLFPFFTFPFITPLVNTTLPTTTVTTTLVTTTTGKEIIILFRWYLVLFLSLFL